MVYDFEREVGIEERLEASREVERGRVCPDCNEFGCISTTWQDVTELGVTYRAPFRHCHACGFDYTDCEYEDIQANALRGRALSAQEGE